MTACSPAHGADPYLQSHPMPADRVAALEEMARSSPYWDKKDDPALQMRHDMVRAKISAFMERQDTVYRRYPMSNESLPARYAHAITTYLHGDLRSALAQIDGLIQAQPNNPYFYELRGQALLEGGKPVEAIAPLRKAVQLSNNAPLIEMLLGQALVATDNKAYTRGSDRDSASGGDPGDRGPAGLYPARDGLWPKGGFRRCRSGLGAGRFSSRRQQDRPRTGLARQNPFRRRHARLGQGRRYRRCKAAARPKQQIEINRAGLPGISRNRLSPRGFGHAFVPLLAPALFALALCGAPSAASAQSFSDSQRGDIETIVRNYLIAHPEVLEEAMAELNKRQAAAEAEKHEASVAANAEAIFNSPRGVVLGNKDGDVTFVEFFDYNCGYCKRAMADMLDLHEDRSQTEGRAEGIPGAEPGFGRGRAGRGRRAHAGSDGARNISISTRGCSAAAVRPTRRARWRAAKDAGLDMARIEKDLTSPEVKATIEENFKLAEAMGMNGTPSYVIGKQVVVGAVGLEGLKEKISLARCGKETC